MSTLYKRQRRMQRINTWLDYRLSIDQVIGIALVAALIGGVVMAWLT